MEMRARFPAVRLIIASACFFALLLTGASAASAAGHPHPIHTSSAEAAFLSDPEVIRAARPAPVPEPEPTLSAPTLPPMSSATGTDVEVTDNTSYPNSIQGKIIYEINNDPNFLFSCSGTIIDSQEQNLVFTAGHCVYDHEANSYPSSMVFIPGYRNDASPDGVFAATNVSAPTEWVAGENFEYDIGAVTLEGTPQATLGARGIAFNLNQTNRSFEIFGYPSKPSPAYDGGRLIRCDAKVLGRQYNGPLSPTGAGPCFMQQGSSGGGWVTQGYVNSVVSFGFCDTDPESCGVIFGPYFSSQAINLYNSVATSSVPTVKFINPPPKKTRKRQFIVKMTGEGTTPIVDFACKLDGGKFKSCPGSVRLVKLGVGRHSLIVRSIDQLGNPSTKQLVRSFRVLR